MGVPFSQPTARPLSGLFPGRCSRSLPPTCTSGSSRSRTRWRKCCRAAPGPAVGPFFPTQLPQAGPGGSEHPGDRHSPATVSAGSANGPHRCRGAPVVAQVGRSPARGTPSLPDQPLGQRQAGGGGTVAPQRGSGQPWRRDIQCLSVRTSCCGCCPPPHTASLPSPGLSL